MEKEKITLIQRFIRWRENNIKEKQFILILSFLVGIFTAFAALILKFFIHSIQNFQCYGSELPLFGLPGGGYLLVGMVRAEHCER